MTTVASRPNIFDNFGELVATAGVVHAIQNVPGFMSWVNKCFSDYSHCRWGQLCKEDKAMNDKAVLNGNGRVVARYNCPISSELTEDVYIITEWDRSVTTVLFWSEY